MISIIKKILPKTRVSHPVSKLLRPVFEMRQIRALFGGIIASTGLLVNLIIYMPTVSKVEALGNVEEMAITTNERINVGVLPETTGVSQGFQAFHPGIDLTAPAGAAIYPVDSGTVILVSNLKTGYGRFVVVAHNQTLTSLYAHMGKIMVEEGQRVEKEIQLGEVGLTGHTTGYHLHLEVRKNGVAINPLPYL
jgi:murein DD-endopeptidase MepM/ murein hydrolase activator NlpD